MKTQVTNKQAEAMNKIVLYGFNYENNFIELVWGKNNPFSDHFKKKFKEAGSFFNFYMNLSSVNKEYLNNHILNTNI